MRHEGLRWTGRKIPGALLLFGMLAAWTWVLGVGQADPARSSASAAQTNPGQKPSPQVTKRPAKPLPAPARKTKVAGRVTTKPTPAKPAAGDRPVSKATGSPAVARDPFKLPPPPAPPGQAGADMTAPVGVGLRGLVISQLKLEGIVRLDTTNTMIAVVTNYTNRAYFLRENDAVYNGTVSKITPDSVYFKENFLDPFGRVSPREVVKKLGSASGEGR